MQCPLYDKQCTHGQATACEEDLQTFLSILAGVANPQQLCAALIDFPKLIHVRIAHVFIAMAVDALAANDLQESQSFYCIALTVASATVHGRKQLELAFSSLDEPDSAFAKDLLENCVEARSSIDALRKALRRRIPCRCLNESRSLGGRWASTNSAAGECSVRRQGAQGGSCTSIPNSKPTCSQTATSGGGAALIQQHKRETEPL